MCLTSAYADTSRLLLPTHYCSRQPIVFLRSVIVSYSPIVLPRIDNLIAIKVVLETQDAVKPSASSRPRLHDRIVLGWTIDYTV